MLEQLLRVGPRSRWLNKGVCDKRRHELARLQLAQVPLRTCKVARTKNPAPLGRIHTGPKQRSGGNENLAVPLNRVHIGRLPFRWPHRIRIRALQIGLTHLETLSSEAGAPRCVVARTSAAVHIASGCESMPGRHPGSGRFRQPKPAGEQHMGSSHRRVQERAIKSPIEFAKIHHSFSFLRGNCCCQFSAILSPIAKFLDADLIESS